MMKNGFNLNCYIDRGSLLSSLETVFSVFRGVLELDCCIIGL